ncbi:hypothetical protein JCM8097_006114 [Rhodosporidiobolus ruineniae]
MSGFLARNLVSPASARDPDGSLEAKEEEITDEYMRYDPHFAAWKLLEERKNLPPGSKDARTINRDLSAVFSAIARDWYEDHDRYPVTNQYALTPENVERLLVGWFERIEALTAQIDRLTLHLGLGMRNWPPMLHAHASPPPLSRRDEAKMRRKGLFPMRQLGKREMAVEVGHRTVQRYGL